MDQKRKALAVLLFGLLFCVACGRGAEQEENAPKKDGIEETTGEISSDMEGTIEVAENLPDRDIKLPEYLEQEKEESPAPKEEEETVYHLSGEEQTKEAREIARRIEDGVREILANKEYYPHIAGISVNSECTEFNVKFSSRDISLYESVLQMSFCIMGNKFQLYQGKQENELMTVVNYIDADSGEIFSTGNSGEIE